MANEHILLIADGRSPTAIRWLNGLLESGFRVSLISTYPLTDDLPAEQTFILPVAMSQIGRPNSREIPTDGSHSPTLTQKIIRRFRPVALRMRYLAGPATLGKYGKILQRIVNEIQPDLVHALRIPYEGMLATFTPPGIPLLVSVWGNDFTLHANANQQMTQWTRQVMSRTDGVVADTVRDIHLARQFGLADEKKTLTVPGGGGIDVALIDQACQNTFLTVKKTEQNPIIINPRGIRAYAQTDIFFQALPMVLEKYPLARIYCPAMQGKVEAIKWVNQLKIHQSVELLPNMPQMELWSLFCQADISVSMTNHDGTPNTLLEAMACGSLPIAGDIESLREWITPGVNGFLVEIGQPARLAEAIINAIENPQFRKNAALINRQLIQQRAEVGNVKQTVKSFYQQFFSDGNT